MDGKAIYQIQHRWIEPKLNQSQHQLFQKKSRFWQRICFLWCYKLIQCIGNLSFGETIVKLDKTVIDERSFGCELVCTLYEPFKLPYLRKSWIWCLVSSQLYLLQQCTRSRSAYLVPQGKQTMTLMVLLFLLPLQSFIPVNASRSTRHMRLQLIRWWGFTTRKVLCWLSSDKVPGTHSVIAYYFVHQSFSSYSCQMSSSASLTEVLFLESSATHNLWYFVERDFVAPRTFWATWYNTQNHGEGIPPANGTPAFVKYFVN